STIIRLSATMRSGFLGKCSDSGCRSSRDCRRERHGIAQLLQTMHVMALYARLVELVKVVRPQIGVGHVVTQHVIDDHEQPMGDGDHRCILAAPPHQALKLGSQIGALGATDDPDHFSQDGAHPAIAAGRADNASTAATSVTLSLAFPSSAWQKRGTSPCRVVASASIHCLRSAQ